MRVTKSTKPVSSESVEREWHVVDMKNKILGRVTNQIATLLQGKHKVSYASYADVGDYVVVINASKVKISGRKPDTKKYSYYSGYPGGLRVVDYKSMITKKPIEVVRHAVSGQLPKNKLRDRRLTRLFIYSEETHPYGEKIKK